MPKTWGERLFNAGTYRRVAFAPWLYAFIWGATLRIGVTDRYPPIPFIAGPLVERVWTILALVCPLLALAAWWLIDHSKWSRATLAGIWVRLTADIGLAAVLVTYHVSVVLNPRSPPSEARIFSRYLLGAIVMFSIMLVARDIWVIRRTEKVARGMRRG